MNETDRELLLALTTAVIRLARHLGYEETALDVREAWTVSEAGK